MKKLFLISCLFSIYAFSFELIHPLDFKGTEEEKQKVISLIKKNVETTYSKIGMDDPITLRMMEEEELKSFKLLMSVKNRTLLDDVINKYCTISMCNYVTIKMMYDEQLKASSKKLAW